MVSSTESFHVSPTYSAEHRLLGIIVVLETILLIVSACGLSCDATTRSPHGHRCRYIAASTELSEPLSLPVVLFRINILLHPEQIIFSPLRNTEALFASTTDSGHSLPDTDEIPTTLYRDLGLRTEVSDEGDTGWLHSDLGRPPERTTRQRTGFEPLRSRDCER